MNRILWILFIVTGLYMGMQSDILARSTPEAYRVSQLEFASRTSSQQILRTWDKIPFAGSTMLHVAKSNTRLNYLLLVLFTALVLLNSYLQMQRERLFAMNELLRFNILLVAVIFILGLMENYFLLHNMRHVDDTRFYINPVWVSIPMYLIAGWTLVILGISVIRTMLTGKKQVA